MPFAAELGMPPCSRLVDWMLGRPLFDFVRTLPAKTEERWALYAGIAVTIAMLIGGF